MNAVKPISRIPRKSLATEGRRADFAERQSFPASGQRCERGSGKRKLGQRKCHLQSLSGGPTLREKAHQSVRWNIAEELQKVAWSRLGTTSQSSQEDSVEEIIANRIKLLRKCSPSRKRLRNCEALALNPKECVA